MNRRDFFKKGTLAGVAVYSYINTGGYFNISTSSKTAVENQYDLMIAGTKSSRTDISESYAKKAIKNAKLIPKYKPLNRPQPYSW